MADIYSDDEELVLTVGKNRSSLTKAKTIVRGKPKHKDDEDGSTNSVENGTPARGRPTKGGKKQNATVIAATGKGRGLLEDADDDESEEPKNKKAKIVARKSAGQSPDRQKKVNSSESSEEKVDLKVKRGRPKKSKGRGRKKAGQGGALKPPYQPTGKPRGRPKTLKL